MLMAQEHADVMVDVLLDAYSLGVLLGTGMSTPAIQGRVYALGGVFLIATFLRFRARLETCREDPGGSAGNLGRRVLRALIRLRVLLGVCCPATRVSAETGAGSSAGL